MTHLFSVLLEQSLTACWVIPAVLLLRFCLKKAPKRVTNLLWLVVAFRLVCPVSFESNVSLVTQAQNLSHAAAELRDEIEAYRPVDTHPTITLPEDMVFDTPVTPEAPVLPENPALPTLPENPQIPESVIPPVETPREQPFISRQLVLQAGCGIWLAGVAAMALFGLLSTLQWRKRVQTAVRCEDGLWRSENVESPFILGVLRPKIYLPFVLPFGAESHVIAHEQAHLKRRDPLWKCFAFVLLAVYWFHPLVWVSYFLFCRDIELACDQQVTRNLDAEGKKAYSRALLACTVSRDPLLCPLSFGEVGVKARVKAVLRKKPGKLLTLTALALCTVLIICCAANPKEEHPWDEAYQQTLEELIKQYGANEDYGLQSVTTLDLWEDGIPELLVVRKVDTTDVGEDEIIVYLYEYVDGLVQPRAKQYFEGDAEIQWKPVEEGIQIMGSWPLTDRSSYPAVQSMEALRIIDLPNQNGYYSVVSHDYLQIDDGRWIIKYPSYSSESSRFLTEEETAALLDGAQSLMGLDYNGFLRKHKGINGQGVTCYQSAFADAVDYVVDDRICYHTVLTDMDLDGYPEMLAASGGKLWLVQYTPGEKTVVYDRTGEKHTLYATALPWEVGCRYGDDQRKSFTVTVLNGRPVVVIGLSGDGSSERLFILEMVDGALKNWSMEATAPVGANGQRDLLYDHQINGQSVSAEEYEELAAKLVIGTLVEYDINDIPWSISGYLNTGRLRKSGYPILEVPQPTDYPGYRKVLTDLIAHYGCYDTGDGTLPVLGLKYAALHDFGEDGSPELITLVNHKDADQQLHMTLRIYGCDGGDTVLRYTTELGARYGQTDVSYAFTLGENFLATYHSQNEWTQEVIRITERLSQDTPYTRVYRASREPSDDPPEEGTLTQFWENGEAVSLGYYGTIMQGTVDRGRHIDACWNVSPAGKTELMVFLEQMGVRTDAPSGYGETVAAAHHSRLSGLMTVHGTTPDGIVGATIVDLEQDSVPELLVQHGMTLELYRYEKNHSRLIWSGDIGLYFGQSDVSNEYVINTHGEQPCIIVYDAEESWTEEVLRVITLKDGIIGEEVLRAWTDDKNAFFPERENLDQFTNNGKVISKAEYDTQRTQLVAGGMWVAAYHPHAFPNSDEYMAQLLDDLAAGKLPTISDSAVQAMTFWLMGSNDGDPLDEETASAFAAVFSREIEGRVPCFEDVPIHWTKSHSPEIDNEYFEFCRYIQGREEDWLILVDQDDITYVCKGIACRLDEKGVLRVAAGVVDVDTFRASLVGEFDGQTLVHRRYHTDCYSGMEGCEDCFRSDLVLWNADRTEYVKLIENAPLANHFEVIAREGNIVTVAYQTGPAHSEYNKTVTVQVDLNKKTCTQAEESDFSVAYGELTYRGKTYDLPQQSALTSGDHTVEQVGKHLLIATHINPDHNAYDVFNTETLTFENSFWGLVLDWQGDDLTTLIYCQWQTLFIYDQLALGEFAQSVDPNVLRVENGWFSDDGSAFTISYSDDTGLVQQEVFPIPDREILVAVNTLDGRTIWRTGLLFCPTYNGLTNTEALALATELVDRYGPVSQWPFESCRVDHTSSGSVKLTLLQPHSESKLCLDYTFYLELDGTIWKAEDCIADGYYGTLVYENDDCAIIASRRAEGCLRGGDPCGYCYVTDLTLWNTDRTKGTLLLEGAELGINFTVLDGPDENGVLSISYHTGLSHSDSTAMVFGDIDLIAGTYTEIDRKYLPI